MMILGLEEHFMILLLFVVVVWKEEKLMHLRLYF